MRIVTEPITEAGFAPFGALVSCDRDDVAGKTANLGTAQRRDFVAEVTNLRTTARLNLATFRCRPWVARPLVLTMLEKHPASSQVFLPMSPGRFLVVVAAGGDSPDLATVRAFVAPGRFGVAYHAGTWHHPMIALGDTIDFSCIVWEDGTPQDCVTTELPPITIAL